MVIGFPIFCMHFLTRGTVTSAQGADGAGFNLCFILRQVFYRLARGAVRCSEELDCTGCL